MKKFSIREGEPCVVNRHPTAHKAQPTTCVQCATLFFFFFWVSSTKQMLFGKAVVVAKQLLKPPSEA